MLNITSPGLINFTTGILYLLILSPISQPTPPPCLLLTTNLFSVSMSLGFVLFVFFLFLFYLIFLFIYLFLLFRAAAAAYGSSQARGRIGATVADLQPQLMAMPDP